MLSAGPEGAAKQFMEALRDAKISTATDLLTSGSKAFSSPGGTLQSTLTGISRSFGEHGGVSKIETKLAESKGELAKVELTVTYQSGRTEMSGFSTLKEKEGWKVDLVNTVQGAQELQGRADNAIGAMVPMFANVRNIGPERRAKLRKVCETWGHFANGNKIVDGDRYVNPTCEQARTFKE